jgi:hypothetical protein
MNRWLKGFLRVISTIILFAGPIVALLMVLAAIVSSISLGDRLPGVVTVGAGLYVLLLCLLIGGVIRLLLSIDDRLERLEARG